MEYSDPIYKSDTFIITNKKYSLTKTLYTPDLFLPSPIQKLDNLSDKCLIYIKREDLIHKSFGGNKWRKLKYNIEQMVKIGKQTLITYGGPFSNHIAATAAVCQSYNIPSVGIIRGEYVDPDNPTLNLAKCNGMRLHHVSKQDYKEDPTPKSLINIIDSYDNPYIVPEGGANKQGMIGMKDLVSEIKAYSIDFDYICVSAGTGTTAAGIINYLEGSSHLLIVNALRNESLFSTISERLMEAYDNWTVLSDYHFGGFARTNIELQKFSQTFYNDYDILLDPIYNSKLIYGVVDYVSKSNIKEDSKILLLHTGGLQGIQAYNYRYSKNWVNF